MGIISDFNIVNNNIKEFLKEKKFLSKKIRERKLTRQMKSSLDKLRKSNVPMTKGNLYELASSIYSAFGDHKYKNLKVEYFPMSQIFRVEMVDLDYKSIKSVTFDINGNSDIISIAITIFNTRMKNKIQQELYHTYNFAVTEFHTNIKEVQKEIIYCNSVLYNIMADYIEMILIKN